MLGLHWIDGARICDQAILQRLFAADRGLQFKKVAARRISSTLSAAQSAIEVTALGRRLEPVAQLLVTSLTHSPTLWIAAGWQAPMQIQVAARCRLWSVIGIEVVGVFNVCCVLMPPLVLGEQ